MRAVHVPVEPAALHQRLTPADENYANTNQRNTNCPHWSYLFTDKPANRDREHKAQSHERISFADIPPRQYTEPCYRTNTVKRKAT